jgi:hypothetical protein
MSDRGRSSVVRFLTLVMSPIGVIIAAGWAAWEFAEGRPGDGVYALGVAALIAIGAFAVNGDTDRQERRDPRAIYPFLAFFGGGALACLTLSVLLIAGAIRGGVGLALVGLAAAAASIYVLLRAAHAVQ